MFEEPCPRCGIYISKDGGCNHMYCQKCRHEFCWHCLGPYYRYHHTVNLACPFRYTALIWSIMMMVFFLNQKLIYSFEGAYQLEWFLVYNLSALVAIDLYVASFFIHIALYNGFRDYVRYIKPYDPEIKQFFSVCYYIGIFLFLFILQIALPYELKNLKYS